MKELLKKILFVLIAIAIGFAGKCFAASLDQTDAIRQSIEEDWDYYRQTNNYKVTKNSNYYYGSVDYFSEYFYLNVCYLMDGTNAIDRGLMNYAGARAGDNGGYDALNTVLWHVADSFHPYKVYWYGVVSILRPLLVFFSYTEILVILRIVLALSVVLTTILLYKRCNLLAAVSWIVSLALVWAWVTSDAFVLAAPFLIVCLGMQLLCCSSDTRRDYFVFLLMGIMEAYFDWNSTPIITYSYPAILGLYLFIRREDTDMRGSFLYVLRSAINWCAGYAGMLCGKWALNSIYTKTNAFAEAIEHFQSNETKGDVTRSMLEQFLGACRKTMSNVAIANGLGDAWYLPWILLLLVAAVILYFGIRRNRRLLLLLLVTVSPYAWLFVFRGHVEVHHWFTYRDLAPVFFGLLLGSELAIREWRGRSRRIVSNE